MKGNLHLQEHSKVMHFLKSQQIYSWASDHNSDTYG